MTQTPGPWSVQPSSNPKNGSGWRNIVSTGCEFSTSYVGEALEKDAYLIAAAPEMLEALNEAFEELNFDGTYTVKEMTRTIDTVRERMAQAITKAERKG